LIAIVITYVGGLILAPIISLAAGALSEGLGTIFASLSQPDVLAAFWRTLQVSLVVVTIHAVFGTLVAWVLVRHRFPADLINGLTICLRRFSGGGRYALLLGAMGCRDRCWLRWASGLPLPCRDHSGYPVRHRRLWCAADPAGGSAQQEQAACPGRQRLADFLAQTAALRWGFIYGLIRLSLVWVSLWCCDRWRCRGARKRLPCSSTAPLTSANTGARAALVLGCSFNSSHGDRLAEEKGKIGIYTFWPNQ
jgi:hypothetical protein